MREIINAQPSHLLISLARLGLDIAGVPIMTSGLAASEARIRQSSVPGAPYSAASEWNHRLPVVALAAVGFWISSYLALVQLGLSGIWDPLFGNGSNRVLHSFVSRWLPVPDAALGMLGYWIETVLGVFGGTARYRDYPWIVVCYGGIAGLLGLTALLLIALQIFVLHAGCTLCLCSALISLLIVGLVRDEVVAAGRVIRWNSRHTYSKSL